VFLWPALRQIPQKVPADLEKPLGYPTVLRRDKDSLWLIAGYRFLARVNMRTGGLERWWHLPDAPNSGSFYWHVTEDGFFLDIGPEIYFVDWAGKSNKLI
jgi:hypothetical protein